jgi:hypothetical protein
MAAMPATGTSTWRISWVAKALDATASDEKIASPTTFDTRSCGAALVASGRPTRKRLTVE